MRLTLIACVLCAMTACASGLPPEPVPVTGEPLHVDKEYSVLRQGEVPVTERDYYMIAGRDELAFEVDDHLRNEAMVDRAGAGLALTGMAVLAALVFVPIGRDTATISDTPQTLGVVGGGLLLGVGTTLFFMPMRKHSPFVLDPKTAQEVADTYNATLQ